MSNTNHPTPIIIIHHNQIQSENIKNESSFCKYMHAQNESSAKYTHGTSNMFYAAIIKWLEHE